MPAVRVPELEQLRRVFAQRAVCAQLSDHERVQQSPEQISTRITARTLTPGNGPAKAGSSKYRFGSLIRRLSRFVDQPAAAQ